MDYWVATPARLCCCLIDFRHKRLNSRDCATKMCCLEQRGGCPFLQWTILLPTSLTFTKVRTWSAVLEVPDAEHRRSTSKQLQSREDVGEWRYLCTNPVTYDTSKERCAFKDGLHKSLRFAVSVVGWIWYAGAVKCMPFAWGTVLYNVASNIWCIYTGRS